jgi:hypothetical protein
MADAYDDSGLTGDEEFVSRIVPRLRTPEHAHPAFEKRVMEKVHGISSLPRTIAEPRRDGEAEKD